MAADQYINATGVATIRDWVNGKFALDSDLDTLSNRVEEIIAEGGEPNVIEVVQKNGTALPVTNKTVNVTVPTTVAELSDASDYALAADVPNATSDLTNDGDGTSPFATEDYVDENGGKIDVIKMNGTTQTITNKEVNLGLATTSADGIMSSTDKTKLDGVEAGAEANVIETVKVNNTALVPDANKAVNIDLSSYATTTDVNSAITTALANGNDPYQTESEVQQSIDDALAGITGIDFLIVQTLPDTGEKGIIYLVPNSGSGGNSYDEYIWIEPTGGTARFEKIGTTEVDLSNYWTSTAGQSNSLTAMTVAEINAILEPGN